MTVPAPFSPGYRLIKGDDLNKALAAGLSSYQSGIVAHAGGGQGSATPVTTTLAEVDTVATANDSVGLPKAVPGLTVVLINNGANSMQVFGVGSDTINGVASETGVAQAAGKTASYHSAGAGKWFRNLSA